MLAFLVCLWLGDYSHLMCWFVMFALGFLVGFTLRLLGFVLEVAEFGLVVLFCMRCLMFVLEVLVFD